MGNGMDKKSTLSSELLTNEGRRISLVKTFRSYWPKTRPGANQNRCI